MEMIGQISSLIILVNCWRPCVKADVEVKEAFSMANPCTMKSTDMNILLLFHSVRENVSYLLHTNANHPFLQVRERN